MAATENSNPQISRNIYYQTRKKSEISLIKEQQKLFITRIILWFIATFICTCTCHVTTTDDLENLLLFFFFRFSVILLMVQIFSTRFSQRIRGTRKQKRNIKPFFLQIEKVNKTQSFSISVCKYQNRFTVIKYPFFSARFDFFYVGVQKYLKTDVKKSKRFTG